MELTRRDFIKLSGAGLGATFLARLGLAPPAIAAQEPLRISKATETTTICPYCAVGCGILVSTENKKVINTEGYPEHPINQGSLCSKGQALYQVSNNKRRLTKVQYRAPGSTKWEEKSWDWALDRIAQKIKETRDSTFIKTEKNEKTGATVTCNRTEAIGCLGGAALDNEECALLVKLMRALGLVYIEHQARI